jgi:polar amino acid transport system permease protein
LVHLTSYEIHTILTGVGKTVVIAVLANVMAFPIGIAAGMARMSQWWIVRFLTGVYIEVFRGTSALVQLFYGYYVLPQIGIHLGSMTVGTLVLALNAGAYAAETARGAIQAVPSGQTEAAAALNLSWLTTRFRIVLPQAWRTMLPSFGNLAIDVLKGTAFLSLVGVPEATATITNMSLTHALKPDSAYVGLLVIYLILSIPLVVVVHLLERRAHRHLRPLAKVT